MLRREEEEDHWVETLLVLMVGQSPRMLAVDSNTEYSGIWTANQQQKQRQQQEVAEPHREPE